MKPKSSKKFTYPHPLVKPFQHYSPRFQNDQQQLPPCAYQPFESSPEMVNLPCPHIFRTNHYVLGDTLKSNSDLELGCIVSPFNNCEVGNSLVSQSQIQRCRNCSTALKGDWVEYSGCESICGMCKTPLASIQEHRIKSNGNESVKTIEFKSLQKQEYVRRILFVIELSDVIQSSDIHTHIANNIELLKEKDEVVEVGFVVFGDDLRVVTKGKNSFQLSVVGDCEEVFAVGVRQMFWKVEGVMDEVWEMLEEMVTVDENCYRKRARLDCLRVLEMVQQQVPTQTQIVLIISNHKTTSVVAQNGSFTEKQGQKPEIKHLTEKLRSKCITVNLFYFFKDRKPLAPLDHILEQLGGSCFTYVLNRQYFHQDFYYDLYQYLHENHYYDIRIKVTTSKELGCTRINHKTFGEKQRASLELSRMGEYSNFNVYLKPRQIDPRTTKALLSVEVSYRHKGTSKSKIINFEYTISPEPCDIYSSIGDECQFFLSLRKMLYEHSLSTPKSPAIYKPLVAQLAKLVKRSDFYFSSSKAFTIHTCLIFSVFYTEYLIRNIESTKTHHFIFKQPSYNWKHLSLQRLSKLISMKLYRIDEQGESTGKEQLFPRFKNIKYTYTNIDEGGIYAIDNGRYIYLYVGDHVSPVTREDFIAESKDGKSVDIVDGRVGRFIEELRANNSSGYLQLRLLGEKDRRVLEEGLYNEGKLFELIKKLAQ